MKKKAIRIGSFIGILFGATIIAHAVTQLFTSKTVTSNLTKKTIFEINLNDGLQAAQVGPGESFMISPSVTNDATEDMYVFIKAEAPDYNTGSLYTYTVDESWTLVEDNAGTKVYAYASDNTMITLSPGDTTTDLTSQMTMQSITNAEYAVYMDINVTITGYAIGTDGVSTDPAIAWSDCKVIGEL